MAMYRRPQVKTDALEIILMRCGLNRDVIGEIRKRLPRCRFCARGGFVTIPFVIMYSVRNRRERVYYISMAYLNKHYYSYKYRELQHVCYVYACYNCRIECLEHALRVNYNYASYTHQLDDKIIKITLDDWHIHHAMIELFQQELPDKVWLYLARYNHLSGQQSKSKRSFWQFTQKYLDRKKCKKITG